MFIGITMIISALLLFTYNQHEASKAVKASGKVLLELTQLLPQNSATDDQSTEMKVVDIDGYGYIGYLSLPTLKLELPVMSEWDYDRMKIAPCRYYGSIKSNDLVIAGHNYAGHFKDLQNLQIGDIVVFTDMDNVIYTFEVGDIEILNPTSTEAMIVNDWDLTLYTCNYIGNKRITIRCKAANYYTE